MGRLEAPLSPATLPDALRILEEVLGERPGNLAPGQGGAIRAALVNRYGADLRRYLAEEAHDGCEYAPAGLEVRFGFEEDEGALPPVTLGTGAEQIKLRGTIDRIDVDPHDGRQAIIRDYKSGTVRAGAPAARWSEDRQLQVALYMIAARELMGLDPVAGFYQPLGGRDLRPRGAYLVGESVGQRAVSTDARSREDLEETLADVRARALALSAAIRRGALTPCPETCSRDGCRHPGICRPG